LVRVWLPDRPGGLGQVAARIGAVRGDIMGVDVLERDGGVAIDEFAVELPDAELVTMLVREVEEVDGASVEECRIVDSFPDPRLDALECAARVCAATSVEELHDALAGEVLTRFLAEWVAIVRGDDLLATGGNAPDNAGLLGALALGATSSPLVDRGVAGPGDLAVARLPRHGGTLLVSRDGHPFRRRERAQLLAIAKIADQAWALLDATSSPPSPLRVVSPTA
jgi:hypothetical protein